MPVSGVGSCASFTEGARASAAGNSQAKSKKTSKRGGTAPAAADAVQKPRPCKQQATVEAWTGRRKGATSKNLAKLFDNEE
ncbi:g1808 [Coccomyxa elongata]